MTPAAEKRTHFDSSEELCRYVAEHISDTCILAFSTGKDAVSAWIQARRFFKRVIPIYFYAVPRVPLVERTLRYYERHFATPIVRCASPDLIKLINDAVFSDPRTFDVYAKAKLRRGVTFEHFFDALREKYDAKGAFVADGRKENDSLRRLIYLRNHGSLDWKRERFFTVYDWSNDRMEQEFKAEGVQLAPDYRFLQRSFEGLIYAQAEPLSRLCPRSWQQALKWMPLGEAQLWRRRYYEQEGLEETAE